MLRISVSKSKRVDASHRPLGSAASQESAELGSVGVFKQCDQKVFIKLEGARKLPQDLPHTVQKKQEHRRFTPRLSVGVG